MKPPLEAPAPALPAALAALVGQGVAAIDTPALVIDLDAMERNLTRMAEFARRLDVRLRPHAKMHKSSALAKLQIQAGAVGVCVQKTAEAEAMASGGVSDIYISNQVTALTKLQRVAHLARTLESRGGKLAIAVDSMVGVLRLAAAVSDAHAHVDVFVELDVGQGRCGLPPGDAALAMVRQIGQHPSLRFAGLQAYHGRAQHLPSASDRRDAIAQTVQAVVETRALIEASGYAVDLVTGAGTGTFALEAASGVYGELQAGSYLFMDADYARNERDPAQPQFEHALFVKSQIISAQPDFQGERMVCDAGHKSHAIDSGLPTVHWPAGSLVKPRELAFANGGDEHGILRGPRLSEPLAIDDTVWLIPGHCDPTVNLHNHLIGVRGGLANGVVERILRVDARGALT